MSKKSPSQSATRRTPSRGKKLAAVKPAEVTRAGRHKRREREARSRQDMCPICAKPFQKHELLIKYFRWEVEASERLAHQVCLVRASQVEQNTAG
jgi:hypothetical protein